MRSPAVTDTSGRFAIARRHAETTARSLLRTRAVGYLMRRDSITLADLGARRLVIVLPEAYAFGDIEGMPCTPRRYWWPFSRSTSSDPNP